MDYGYVLGCKTQPQVRGNVIFRLDRMHSISNKDNKKSELQGTFKKESPYKPTKSNVINQMNDKFTTVIFQS